jgi:hypothetical protein
MGCWGQFEPGPVIDRSFHGAQFRLEKAKPGVRQGLRSSWGSTRPWGLNRPRCRREACGPAPARPDRSKRNPPRRWSANRLRPPPRRAKLPKIAEKADDLGAIKKAVDDAASVGGGLWLFYLFVLFYLAVAAGAVTHADLFLENPVKLPFLNIELPLLAFFLAPILSLVVHSYTLVHLVMLTDKAKRFHQALHAQIGDGSIRDGLRRQLPSNIFVQFLAGPAQVRESAFGWLLEAIAWVVLLLLLMQIPVPAVSRQFCNLVSASSTRGRYNPRVVAMAQDPVCARSRRRTRRGPLGFDGAWPGVTAFGKSRIWSAR